MKNIRTMIHFDCNWTLCIFLMEHLTGTGSGITSIPSYNIGKTVSIWDLHEANTRAEHVAQMQCKMLIFLNDKWSNGVWTWRRYTANNSVWIFVFILHLQSNKRILCDHLLFSNLIWLFLFLEFDMTASTTFDENRSFQWNNFNVLESVATAIQEQNILSYRLIYISSQCHLMNMFCRTFVSWSSTDCDSQI